MNLLPISTTMDEWHAWHEIVSITRDRLNLPGVGHSNECRCAQDGCKLLRAIRVWGDKYAEIKEASK